jgi:putative tricarboxylic transport membrane protein
MNKERAAGLIFLATGIYGFVFSMRLSLGTWDEPGPAIFPLGVSLLLMLAGALTFLFGRPKAEGRVDWRQIVRQLYTPVRIVGLTAAYILVLDWLGYLLTSALFIFLLFLWVSRYRFWAALGLSIAIGIGSWYFFEKILAVQLPRGFLPF